MDLVEKYLKRSIPSIDSYSSVEAALEIMSEKGSHVLFVYEDGKFSEVIGGNDLAGYPPTRIVADCRVRPFNVVGIDEPLDAIFLKISDNYHNFTVVVDAEGVPAGIIDYNLLIVDLIKSRQCFKSFLPSTSADAPDGFLTEGIAIDEIIKKVTELEKFAQLGNLFLGLTHDLNNILSAIVGYSELALSENKSEDGAVLNKKLDTRIKNILATVINCNRLLSNISSLAKSSKDLENELIDIDELIDAVIELFSASLTQSRIIIEKNYDSIAGKKRNFVRGNKAKMMNVFSNMIVNSKDAIKADGKIFIKSRNINIENQRENKFGFKVNPGEYIEVSLSDTGEGIPENNMNRLFTPFYTTKVAGTGVGLVNIKATLENMGGFAEVENGCEGNGACFKVYFPICFT